MNDPAANIFTDWCQRFDEIQRLERELDEALSYDLPMEHIERRLAILKRDEPGKQS